MRTITRLKGAHVWWKKSCLQKTQVTANIDDRSVHESNRIRLKVTRHVRQRRRSHKNTNPNPMGRKLPGRSAMTNASLCAGYKIPNTSLLNRIIPGLPSACLNYLPIRFNGKKTTMRWSDVLSREFLFRKLVLILHVSELRPGSRIEKVARGAAMV